MKTPEDEAFDELATRQGDWGGGYRAKREAALDRLVQEQERLGLYDPAPQPAQEPVCDKDPQSCWNVRCQLGKQCKNLAQPAQEPVAWMSKENDCIFFDADKPNPMDYEFWTPLYITLPQRPWAGLTEEDLHVVMEEESCSFIAGARWAEEILKGKNT